MHTVIALQHGAPGARGQEQVTTLMESHGGRLVIHRQVVGDIADKVAAELRHANVFRRGKLLPYRRHRTRGGAFFITEIALDHQYRALEIGLGTQEECGGTADNGAAYDHHIGMLHREILCRPDRLLGG